DRIAHFKRLVQSHRQRVNAGKQKTFVIKNSSTVRGLRSRRMIDAGVNHHHRARAWPSNLSTVSVTTIAAVVIGRTTVITRPSVVAWPAVVTIIVVIIVLAATRRGNRDPGADNAGE